MALLSLKNGAMTDMDHMGLERSHSDRRAEKEYSDRTDKDVNGGSGADKKPLSLYVHIPFCVRKCDYCDFLSAPASEEVRENYVNLLCREMEREAALYPDYRVETVFFGGGTPTVLKPEQLEKLLCKLKECFFIREDAAKMPGSEITLECNPGTVGGEELKKLREAGFNRLSIGAQSMRNEELERLGRIHTREDFQETFRRAREAGFRNLNVDLMSALPGQSVESYVNSLREVVSLHPEHISAYSLIVEEGTPFYERYGEADAGRRRDGEDKDHLLPSEEEERRMYEVTREILEESGYHRYEISNYALPGCECRHNITYWRRGDYLGLGLGAASLMGERRFTKSRELKEYEKMPEEKENMQLLTTREQMEEFMFLGLRLMSGVSRREFFDYFHVPMEKIYGEVLKKLEQQKLLTWQGDGIYLTKRGIDVSNVVLAEFLLS